MKKLLLIILAILVMLMPSPVLAEGALLDNGELTEWEAGAPKGWVFYSPTGNIYEEEGSATLSLEEAGFALLTQPLSLEPQTCYKITADISNAGFTGDVGANIHIPYQGAYSQNNGDTLELYVHTNVDETQEYMLCVGLGDEDCHGTGSVTIGNIAIEQLEIMPDDKTVYTLIGSVGIEGYGSVNQLPEEEDNSAFKEKTGELPSYNYIGAALVCCFILTALYLLITGYYGKKLSAYLEKGHIIKLIFAFAFILRLYIAMTANGFETDLNCFIGWGASAHEYGLSGIYESGIFIDYPPLYIYVLWLTEAVRSLLGLSFYSAQMMLLIKLPAIICDMALAYILYSLAKKRFNKPTASLLSLILLFSPLLMVVSCAWGQIDSVFTLMVVGIILLLKRNKTVYAAGLYMLTLLLKPQALLIAPVIAIMIIKELADKSTRKKLLIDLAVSIPVMLGLYAAVSLPLKGEQGFLYVFERMAGTTSQYAYASVNAFNLFGLLGQNYTPAGESFLFATYSTFGWLMIALSTVFAGWLYFKKPARENLFTVTGVYLTCIFMLSHQMHERYIFTACILLLFAAVMADSRRLLFSHAAISIGAFLNIFTVLVFSYTGAAVADWIVRICSAINIAAFIFLILSVLWQLKGRQDASIAVTPQPLADRKQRKAENARLRLTTPVNENRRLNNKDRIIILVITALYGALAFINLGSTNIPEKTEPMESFGDSVVIEYPEGTYAQELYYYTGYCSGDFTVYISEDGVNYYAASDVHHEYANMFRWYSVQLNAFVTHIKIELLSGDLELREAGIACDGRFIKPITQNSATDEFNELPHNGTSYMTEMYFDEIYHARTAYEYMHNIEPYEITHPPLGKSIIALGCEIFGFNPFGWRFMGALAGVLMLPVLYILLKRIFASTKWAVFGTLLMAFDFMHYTQTRIATIDSFSVLFILLMYLFMLIYTQMSFMRQKLWRTFIPLGLCGLAFALGAATKWICLYSAPGLLILFIYAMNMRYNEYKVLKEQGGKEACLYKRNLIATLAFCVNAFIIIPVAVYILSYIPYFNAEGGYTGLADIWANQQYMLNYHGNLSGDPHPYQSSVYTWAFDIRPVFFFNGSYFDEASRAVIWCMANPVVGAGGLICSTLLLRIRRHPAYKLEGMGVAAVALLCQLLPWVIISREVFAYHFFSIIPFLIIFTTYFIRHIATVMGKKGKAIAIGLLAAALILFILFYPVITGTTIDVSYGRFIRWSPLWPISV